MGCHRQAQRIRPNARGISLHPIDYLHEAEGFVGVAMITDKDAVCHEGEP
jgi:hypothetical protein